MRFGPYAKLALIALAVVIGAAVARYAFGSSAATPPTATPHGPEPRRATVEVANIRSAVTLDGVLAPALARPTRSPIEGRVVETTVATASTVATGQVIARVMASDGTTTEAVADSSGTLDLWLVASGDQVHQGDVLASIQSATLDGVATVPADILYRFYTMPTTATVLLDHGPAPFDCPITSLGGTTLDPSSTVDAPVSGSLSPQADTGSPAEMRCSVPENIVGFPGVPLKLAVVTGEADAALVLPLQAVAGDAQQGFVTVVAADGGHSRRTVRLGITDGVPIQVVDGLQAGDTVLVPPEVLPQDVIPVSP